MALLRLLPGATGTVLWDGTDVSNWPEARLRPQRRRFQVLLQSPYAMLTPFLTVREHLDETLRLLMGVRRPGPADWGSMVEELALEQVLESYPAALSGGEARRVGLARVLLCRPEFLFADEPDAGLDPPRRMALASRLRALAHGGVAILLVTHDEPTLLRTSDRLFRLQRGTLGELSGE
jgi:peptide/nickel transport system ATP-binding protein